MNIQTTTWRIIKIEVKHENEIIPIDYKLANNIGNCQGIHLAVSNYLNTKSSYIPQIGEISLVLNAKTDHPLHFTAEYNKDLSAKTKVLKLESDIKSNTNITGFYKDYGKTRDNEGVFLPYTISLYLRCVLNPFKLRK